MNRISKSLALVVLVLFTLITGCNINPGPLPQSPYPGPYPAPQGQSENSPSPVPRSLTPTVTATDGAIRATLFYTDTNRPVRDQLFFAAKMLPLSGGSATGEVPSLDTNTSPRDESDQNGRIVISLVPPGHYALAIMTPLGPILIKDTQKNTEITFDVSAANLTDLGDLKTDLDPNFLEPAVPPVATP